MDVGVEDVSFQLAGAGERELVARRRQDVEVAELLADGEIRGHPAGAAPLVDRVGAARRHPADAARQEELVGHVLDEGVLCEPADVEKALVGAADLHVAEAGLRIEARRGASSPRLRLSLA